MDKKNISVTANKHAKIYTIYLLIVFKLVITGPSPIGCSTAAAILYVNAIAKIFSAGNKARKTMIITPTIPIAFFNNKEALSIVSAASVNVSPTIGIKFTVINFDSFIANQS